MRLYGTGSPATTPRIFRRRYVRDSTGRHAKTERVNAITIEPPRETSVRSAAVWCTLCAVEVCSSAVGLARSSNYLRPGRLMDRSPGSCLAAAAAAALLHHRRAANPSNSSLLLSSEFSAERELFACWLVTGSTEPCCVSIGNGN